MVTDGANRDTARVGRGSVQARPITEELAMFCTSLEYADLPPEVVDAAKYFALDFAGVALRGSREESSEIIYRTLRAFDGGLDSGVTVAGHRERMQPLWAAMANASAAHAIELDDTHQEGSIHPGVVVFPTALAVAEAENAGGRDLLTAAVVGYEVACRLAMALQPAEHYRRGFHPTATCGVFSSAAVAARLMRLSEAQTVNAFGIAGSQAAGSLEFLADGAWTKRFHPGWASHAGILAAQLARNGFTGPRSILEGRSGFLHSYSDAPRPERVCEDLGSHYEILRTAIKPHACCRYNQAPIDSVLQIVATNDINPADIAAIRIGLLQVAFPIVAEPVAQKRRPASVVDAQFSAPYAAAVAALRGRAGIEEYGPQQLNAPDVLEMMDRVECVPAPDLDALFPKQWPATVEVVLSDGTRLQNRVDYPKGDPQNPLTWDELSAKFGGLVAGLIPDEQAAQLLTTTRRLESMPASSWARLLAAD